MKIGHVTDPALVFVGPEQIDVITRFRHADRLEFKGCVLQRRIPSGAEPVRSVLEAVNRQQRVEKNGLWKGDVAAVRKAFPIKLD